VGSNYQMQGLRLAKQFPGLGPGERDR